MNKVLQRWGMPALLAGCVVFAGAWDFLTCSHFPQAVTVAEEDQSLYDNLNRTLDDIRASDEDYRRMCNPWTREAERTLRELEARNPGIRRTR